jgi:uncharacterized protein (TIGR00725 family)
MSGTYRLDRASATLCDAAGLRLDLASGAWVPHAAPPDTCVDAIAAATWRQRESGQPLRVPVGVIGPRAATGEQLAVAEAVGEGIARMGFAVVCGGRDGVMAAVAQGARRAGGTTIGLLPEADPAHANPYIDVIIATGIGEARNALIARAAVCLVAIGDSFGTLSEVALGRHFGKLVIGLAGAARIEGVRHVATVQDALVLIAEHTLGGPR